MRRKRVVLAHILTAVSLLAFVAVMALWGRSQRTCDLIYRASGMQDIDGMGGSMLLTGSGFQLGSSRGVFWIGAGRMEVVKQGLWWPTDRFYRESSRVSRGSGYTQEQLLDSTSPAPRYAGFDLASNASPGTSGEHFGHRVVVPYWFAALLTLIRPAKHFIHAYRARIRFARGACQVCGYDLRATPDRCPECGTGPMQNDE